MRKLIQTTSLALLIGASVMTAAPALAADKFKAGVVNIERIFRDANVAKSSQTRLEQEFSKREQTLQQQGKNLQAAAEKFERDQLTMSDSQRQETQRQLMDQNRDFERKRREFQEDLNARKNEELQKLLERANKVVREIAEKEQFDLILQEAVYFAPGMDITDKVIKALNESN